MVTKEKIKEALNTAGFVAGFVAFSPVLGAMNTLQWCLDKSKALGEKIMKEGGRFSPAGTLLKEAGTAIDKTMNTLTHSDAIFLTLLSVLGIAGGVGAGQAVMAAAGFSFSTGALLSAKAALVIGSGIVAAPIAAGLATFLIPLSAALLYGAVKTPKAIYNVYKNIPAEGALDMSPEAVLVRKFETLTLAQIENTLLALKEKFPQEFMKAAEKTGEFSFSPALGKELPYSGPLNMAKKKSFFSFK